MAHLYLHLCAYSYYSSGKTEACCPSQQGEHPCAWAAKEKPQTNVQVAGI